MEYAFASISPASMDIALSGLLFEDQMLSFLAVKRTTDMYNYLVYASPVSTELLGPRQRDGYFEICNY